MNTIVKNEAEVKQSKEVQVKYTIYQAKKSTVLGNKFKVLDNILKSHENICRHNYKLVYTGTISGTNPENVLNKIWKLINYNTPSGYKGKPISTGDVIRLEVNDLQGYFYFNVDHWIKVKF